MLLLRKAAMVALSAVAIGGIALATPAQAAELGHVRVDSSDKAWTMRWGTGWDACKSRFPATKSIKRQSTSSPGENQYYSIWRCFDTP